MNYSENDIDTLTYFKLTMKNKKMDIKDYSSWGKGGVLKQLGLVLRIPQVLERLQ